MNEAHISQPICTAIQLALTDLLRSWGVTPSAVAGHSSGEIGAAYAAGILPLNSCMAIAYYRGMVTTLLKKKYPDLKGTMMAVGCTKEEVEPLIAQLTKKEVKIACYNSPTSLTISGDVEAIDELQAVMEKSQTFARKLAVEMAYHSHHMELVAKDYMGCLSELEAPVSTNVKFHSSLLGQLVEGTTLQPSYWVDNLTQSVRFSEALTSMCAPTENFKTGVNMLIEIGPHSALAGPIKQILKSCGPNAMKIPYTSALVRKRDAVETAMELASTLFTRGATLEMGAVNLPSMNKTPALLVDMPRYPWNHQTRYWHENRMMQKHKGRKVARNDLLGTLASYSNDLEPTWRNILRVEDLPWLRHHKIQSILLFPMSGFIAMAVEAASQRAATRDIQFENFELRDVSVHTPLMLTDDDVEVTLQLRPKQETSSDLWDEFRVHSWSVNKGWTEHAKGLISVNSKSQSAVASTVASIGSSEKEPVEKEKIYDSLSELGVSYGSSFQGMNNCHANDSCSMAHIETVNTMQDMPKEYQSDSVIHPALLEQLIEMYWPIIGAGRTPISTVYLPSSIGRISISRQISDLTRTPGSSLHAFCTGARPLAFPRPIQMSMFATSNDSLEPLIMVDDLTIAPIIERDVAMETEAHRELCYKLDWEPILHSPDVSATAISETEATMNGASTESSDYPNEKITIIHGDLPEQLQLAAKLAEVLAQETGQVAEVGALNEVETDGKLCLFLSEINEALLSTLTPDQFTHLQKVLTSVQGILWVVRGAYVNSTSPHSNMVAGLSRSIRSETLLKFATLDLDSKTPLDSDGSAKAILDVFKAVFGAKAEPNCELEFMEKNGAFYTPRIVNDPEMDEYVHKQTKAATLEPTLFVQEDRPLKLTIQTPGSLETIHFVDQATDEPLLDDEIEVQVKAIAMNPRDISTAMGQFDALEFGSECSGIVTKIGSGVQDLVVGARVACISTSGGVYSTYARAKSTFTVQLSDQISFDEAAAMPVAYCTAYYGLIDLGRLEKDECVLINGASSPAGQAAIVAAHSMGAEVFAVVDNPEDKTTLINTYGIQEDHCMLSQQSLPKNCFDVLLNCISTDSDTSRELWSSLSDFGRFVELCQSTTSRLNTSQLGNKSFMSVDIMSLATQRPKILSRVLSNVSRTLLSEKKNVLQTTVYPISDIETAFKVLQSGEFSGKLLISPQAGEMVKATPSSKQNQLLKADATYILIGGTGGLGRSMAKWMVGKGARNLVLVSRSGSVKGKVKELIDEQAAVGASIVVKSCDIADASAVDALVAEISATMPAIRGVIHGAMVLNVSTTHSPRYVSSTSVRIQTTH